MYLHMMPRIAELEHNVKLLNMYCAIQIYFQYKKTMVSEICAALYYVHVIISTLNLALHLWALLWLDK